MAGIAFHNISLVRIPTIYHTDTFIILNPGWNFPHMLLSHILIDYNIYYRYSFALESVDIATLRHSMDVCIHAMPLGGKFQPGLGIINAVVW